MDIPEMFSHRSEVLYHKDDYLTEKAVKLPSPMESFLSSRLLSAGAECGLTVRQHNAP